MLEIKKRINKYAYTKHVLKVVKLLRNLTIKQRIIGSLFLISIFPIVLVGIYSSKNYENSVISKLTSYSGQLVQEISQNVENEINQYEKLSEIIMIDDDVKNYLTNYKHMSDHEKNVMAHNLSDKFNTELFQYKNVQNINIWADQDTDLYDMGYDTYNNADIKRIMHAVDRQKYNLYWTYIKTKSGRDCIALCRQIYMDYNYKKIGYIFIFVDESIFANDTYKDIDLGKGSNLIVLQSDGILISTNSQSLEKGKKIADKAIIKKLELNYENNISAFEFESERGKFIYATAFLPTLDWYVVGKIPYSYISNQTVEVKKSILFFCILIIVLSIIISTIIYSSIYVPLKNLVQYAKRITGGELSVTLNDKSNDEFGVLSQNIELMVERLRNLIDEVIKQQSKKREAEISMLQAQINPHFMFNALNSLRWSAMLSGNHTLEKGIEALSGLLQNTIINSNELITLEEEIKNVNNYAVIQKIRYADSFTLSFDVDENLYKAKVIKFILQPIIENSIIHGSGNSERIINIKMTAYALDNVLNIEICDDGQGFIVNKQDLKSNKKRLSGIGISNVNERIRLNFGEAFGLQTESILGKGTVSYLKMPLLYETEDENV